MVELRQTLPWKFDPILPANQNAPCQTLNRGVRCIATYDVQDWTQWSNRTVVITVGLRSIRIQERPEFQGDPSLDAGRREIA
jgi:hypothetical protein